MVLRGGIGGLIFRLRDGWLRSVARRNAIIVPSLLADVRVDEVPLERAEEAAEHHDGAADTAGPGPASSVAGAAGASGPPPATEPPDPPPPAPQPASTGGGPR